MYQKSIKTLEYDKIMNEISTYACSDLAKEKILNLMPFENRLELQEALQSLEDAYMLLNKDINLDFRGLTDIRPLTLRAKKGGNLSISALYDTKVQLEIVKEIKNSLNSITNDKEKINTILEKTELLSFVKDLYDDLNEAVKDRESIAEDATPLLKSINKKIIKKNDDINDKLKSFISDKSNEKYIQESLITIRDGRYVIPIKREYKNNVSGIIHDVSSSGGTYFIEPSKIVELNNEIRELEIKKQEEIFRIIKDLSARIGHFHDELNYNSLLLLEMDFIFAKAKYSKERGFNKPIIVDELSLDLKDIFHPLIPEETVIKTNLKLDDKTKVLVITGPNTGGKTVVLKTVGLISLLAKSGMFIPASYGSKVPIFKEIYTDIGDEQSIEQNLSTFSSHMVNIVDILNENKSDSLYLFDELGAGTDPTEGAALAMSILDTLLEKDVKVLATTHYAEIKLFALKNRGVVNGSMEFDIKSLMPTYKLNIGLPGRSNAFDISRKLGLSENYIEKASSFISDSSIKFEDVLSEIEENRQKSIGLKNELDSMTKQMKIREELAIKEIEKDRDKAKRELDRAKEEAKEILFKAKRDYEEALKEIKEMKKDLTRDNAKTIQERRDLLRENLNKVSKRDRSKKNKSGNVKRDEIRIGETYFVKTVNGKGNVIELPDESNEVLLMVGILKVRANVKDLVKTTDEEDRKEKMTSKYNKKSAMYVKSQLDLRGLNAEEIYDKLDKYLDDCFLAGLKEATILHGKGSGVLRSETQKILSKNPHVKSYRLGNIGEGDTGVTIVNLK